MRTVWKFELQPETYQRIAMPAGAQLLSVGGQRVTEMGRGFARAGTFPMLWALVDPDAPLVDRRLALVGTGHAAPDQLTATFIGTAICDAYVWHVFDGGEVES